MQVRPVKKYKLPKYPDQELFFDKPELLLSNAPADWFKKKTVIAALTAFTVGSSYAESPVDKPVVEQVEPSELKEQAVSESEIKIEDKRCKIAPLFIHGEGRGATGCVVISPPCFMSEVEAFEIIVTELRKAGIEFPEFNYHWKDDFSKFKGYDSYDADEPVTIKSSLVFDAFNEEKNLGIKFVSILNHNRLTDKDTSEEMRSSVQSYDLMSDAQLFREKLKEDCEVNAAVFYDPMSSWERTDDGKRNDAKAESKELLKQQVTEFIDWFRLEFGEEK